MILVELLKYWGCRGGGQEQEMTVSGHDRVGGVE